MSSADDPLALFLAELAAAIARPAERSRGLARLCAALGAMADGSALLCTLQPDGLLRCDVGTGDLAPLEGDVVPQEGTLEGEAIRSAAPVTTENLRADPRAFLAFARDLPNTPAVALPLLVNGNAEGVALVARRGRRAPFAEAEIGTLQGAAPLLGGALRGFAEVERVRASRAVVEAWRGAREHDAELARRVIRAVRHELNTPVAVLQGNLQLCASDDPAEWKVPACELWQTVRAETARLEALSQLLHQLDGAATPVVLDSHGRFVPPASS